MVKKMHKTGIELIAEERIRQVEQEGWSFEHDDEHTDEELALAAVCYALPCPQCGTTDAAYANDDGSFNKYEVAIERAWFWPWDKKWWKPTPDDRIRELVKAGALIAAEIDRLLRAE